MAFRRIPFGAFAVGALFLAGAGLTAWSYIDGRAAKVPSRQANVDGSAAKPLLEKLVPPPNANLDKPLIPKAERELLWDIENQGITLGDTGFKAIAAALKKADLPALLRLMSADFQGEAPGPDSELVRETPTVKAIRRRDEGRPLEKLNREQFAQRLLELRAIFQVEPKVKLSLKALVPAVRDKLDGRWQGSALLRMFGEATPGQPAEVLVNLSYVIDEPDAKIAPAEGPDANPAALARDGWWHSATLTQSTSSRATHFLMRDVTKERGIDTGWLWDNWLADAKNLPTIATTGGVYLTDYDRDGYVDMLVADVEAVRLYRGLPAGKFEDVTVATGVAAYNSDDWTRERGNTAVFVDMDGDGWDDLVVGAIVLQNVPGQEGRKFVRPELSYLLVPPGVVSATVFDFDRDGRLDLYFSQAGRGKADSWLDGRSGNPQPNILWRNSGNFVFKDVTAQAGAGGGFRSTFATVCLDANNDDWPDLYVINEFGDGVLLVNNQNGTFREQMLSPGPVDYGSMGVTAGDIDNDGLPDIYVANMYSKAGNRVIGNLAPNSYDPSVMDRMRSFTVGSQLYINRGDNRFEGVGRQWQVHDVGWAYGPSLVDLDNDGWLDLYATCGFISRDRDKPDG